MRRIAEDLGISRNTVSKYVHSTEVPKPKPRPRAMRAPNLDAYKEYIDGRLTKSLENYVHPRRRPRQPKATVRFETASGEQAQVDWGVFNYIGEDGRKHRMWAFVMVLGWSRAIYVEFVRRADVATFIRCHLNPSTTLAECRDAVCTTTPR